MNMRTIAKQTPVRAAAVRTFLWVTFRQASGVGIGSARADGDGHVHLELVEAGGHAAVVEADARLQGAGGGVGGGGHREHVLLVDARADPLHPPPERVVRAGLAGYGCPLPGADAPPVVLVDLRPPDHGP